MSVQMYEQDYARGKINNNLSHTVLCLVLYSVNKGLCGQNIPHQLLLILLCICSRSVRPMWTMYIAMSLCDIKITHTFQNNVVEAHCYALQWAFVA